MISQKTLDEKLPFKSPFPLDTTGLKLFAPQFSVKYGEHKVFDIYIYSIGSLHHNNTPERGPEAVLPIWKTGGSHLSPRGVHHRHRLIGVPRG
jgi:hypothetical protein